MSRAPPSGRVAQRIIGSCVRGLRQQAGLTLTELAGRCHLSYQYLSGIETGKENFSIQVLERLVEGLELPLHAMIDEAYRGAVADLAPRMEPQHLRSGAPVPPGFDEPGLEKMVNEAQLIMFRINRGVRGTVGRPLHEIIGPELCQLAADAWCTAVTSNSPFRRSEGSERVYCLTAPARAGKTWRLEIDVQPTGEVRCRSCHGAGGWHLAPRYEVDAGGELRFVHVMLAELRGRDESAATHWRRCADDRFRFEASRFALTRLLDATVVLTGATPPPWNQIEQRAPGESAPPWSIFVRANAAA